MRFSLCWAATVWGGVVLVEFKTFINTMVVSDAVKNVRSLKIMDLKKCIVLIYYELILTVSFFLLDLGFPHASQYSSVNVPDPHCFKSHTHATCLQLDLSWNICKRLEKFRHHNTHFTLYKKKKKKKKKTAYGLYANAAIIRICGTWFKKKINSILFRTDDNVSLTHSFVSIFQPLTTCIQHFLQRGWLYM